MKVILTEEVPDVGAAGQVVEVAPGYARNYLLPRKLAIEATKGNVKSLEHHRRTIEARQKKLAQSATALADRIRATPLVIAARAGETGRLYGSVTTADIAEAVQRMFGLEVDKRKVEIPEPIKVLGDHEVKVRLHRDVQATLTVSVIAESASPEEAKPSRGEAAGEVQQEQPPAGEPPPSEAASDEAAAAAQ
jgi:large subunit ribosomal protein L9